MSFLSNFLFGSKGGTEKLSTLTPEQKKLADQMISELLKAGTEGVPSGIDLLKSLISGEDRGFEEPYRREFQEQTLPSLAERFAGAGALSSSGFGQAIGAAGAGLQSQLAQLGSQRQMGALSSLLDLYFGGGQRAIGEPQFMYREKPASAGLMQYAGAGLARGLFG